MALRTGLNPVIESNHSTKMMKVSPSYLHLFLMVIGFILPALGSFGSVIGLGMEVLLLLLLVGYIINGNQTSEKFFLYLGILIGGELFFRNFAHRNIPGYMIIEYVVFGLGVLSAGKVLRSLQRRHIFSLFIWLIFVLFAAVSLIYSPSPADGRVFLSIFAAGLAVITICVSFAKRNHLLRLFEGVSLGVSLVFGVMLYYEIFRPVAGRFAHSFNSAVQNGIFLTIGVICLVILTKKLHFRWYKYLIPIGILSFGALLTFSRGPLIGLMIAVLGIILSESKINEKFGNLLLALLVIAILAAIVYSVAPEQFLERYIGIAVDTERTSVWDVALRLSEEKPILGWGIGSWKVIYPQYSWMSIESPEYISDAHNIFIQVLVELGSVGLFFFLTFLFTIFIKVIRRFSLELTGLFGYVLIVGFVENWKVLIFFVLLGYLLASKKVFKKALI